MEKKHPDLDAAYALQSPDDNRKLYADWANSYDSGFATPMQYRLPGIVADAYRGDGPVLDVGAGTGLVGQALSAHGIGPVDGIDISAPMLAVAREKGVYRDLMIADLTQPLEFPFAAYRGVVSAGTFTHGHVGASAIPNLLTVAAPGARFVFSVNKGVFSSGGFEGVLRGLSEHIHDLTVTEVAIYGDAADPAHRQDTAMIVSFTRS